MQANPISQTALNDQLINILKQDKFSDIHIKHDPYSGMIAIIAIHSTKLGPSLGGCRFIHYDHFADALNDVMRLAKAMSYKSAITNLPLGGGKGVIIKPMHDFDRAAYFRAFGGFIEELNGRYITGIDLGSYPKDMDEVAKFTKHVTCLSKNQIKKDVEIASYYTAQGTLAAMQAAAKFKFGKDSLNGLHIAIQGLGKVGSIIAKDLFNRGAKLTIADTHLDLVKIFQEQMHAEVVSPDEILFTECDMLAPCALGGILNSVTIPKIKAPIIVGCANTQLGEINDAELLHERGILYGPDYVVNSGGLIFAASEYYHYPESWTIEKVKKIYDTTLEVFTRAQQANSSTQEIADTIALEHLR